MAFLKALNYSLRLHLLSCWVIGPVGSICTKKNFVVLCNTTLATIHYVSGTSITDGVVLGDVQALYYSLRTHLLSCRDSAVKAAQEARSRAAAADSRAPASSGGPEGAASAGNSVQRPSASDGRAENGPGELTHHETLALQHCWHASC